MASQITFYGFPLSQKQQAQDVLQAAGDRLHLAAAPLRNDIADLAVRLLNCSGVSDAQYRRAIVLVAIAYSVIGHAPIACELSSGGPASLRRSLAMLDNASLVAAELRELQVVEVGCRAAFERAVSLAVDADAIAAARARFESEVAR